MSVERSRVGPGEAARRGSRRPGGAGRPRSGPCTARSSRTGSRRGRPRPRRPRPRQRARRRPGSRARSRGRRCSRSARPSLGARAIVACRAGRSTAGSRPRGETGQDLARSRPLDREDRRVLADVLDRDAAAAPMRPCEPGEVRLGATSGGSRRRRSGRSRRPRRRSRRHRARPCTGRGPTGQVRMSRARTPARNASASGPVDPVLEERRRVEEPGAVADREVLELLGQLVSLGDEIARPVLPQAGLVGRARPLVERRRADHRELADDTARWTLAQ